MKMITIELRQDDAEPILREAARKAALNGGRWLYITRKTCGAPTTSAGFDADSEGWHREYLAAERMVEAFGVEAEVTSEAETMTITFQMKNQKQTVVRVPGIGPVAWRSGGEMDYKRPLPSYRGGIHQSAAEAAADRVVRRWRGE